MAKKTKRCRSCHEYVPLEQYDRPESTICVWCKNHREVVIKLPEAKPVKEIMSMDYFESIMRRIKNG